MRHWRHWRHWRQNKNNLTRKLTTMKNAQQFYAAWTVEKPQRHPVFRSTWRGQVPRSRFAEMGLIPVSKVPHDLFVQGIWVDLEASLQRLAEFGYAVAPIIAQCNTWAVTEYGIESLLFPRDYPIEWHRVSEDWAAHFRGKVWYDDCWTEVSEVLHIARKLRGRFPDTAERVAKAQTARRLLTGHRYRIFQRDNYRCRICGAAQSDGEHVRLEVDHITPRSKGGTDDDMNLWTLCFACNRGKGTHEL